MPVYVLNSKSANPKLKACPTRQEIAQISRSNDTAFLSFNHRLSPNFQTNWPKLIRQAETDRGRFVLEDEYERRKKEFERRREEYERRQRVFSIDTEGPSSADSTYTPTADFFSLTHTEFMGAVPAHVPLRLVSGKCTMAVCNKNSLEESDQDISTTTLPEKNLKSLQFYATDTVLKYFQQSPNEIVSNIFGTQNAMTTLSSPSTPIAWGRLWGELWNMMASQGLDNLRNFQIFAGAFTQDPGFVCHDQFTYDKGKSDISGNLVGGARHVYLGKRLVAGKNNHRFDRLPYNINLAKLSESLKGQTFNHIVLLDLSYSQLDRVSYLRLTSLSSLVGLDVTGCANVDDGVLHAWVSVLKNRTPLQDSDSVSQAWPNLRMLMLGDNSKYGDKVIESLFKLCTTITYIEVDQEYVSKFDEATRSFLGINNNNFGVSSPQCTNVWAPRRRIFDHIKQAAVQIPTPKHDSNSDAPLSAVDSFSQYESFRKRGLGLGQKYFALRELFSEMKDCKLAGSEGSSSVMLDPELDVESHAQGRRYIVQEFEVAPGMPASQPVTPSLKNISAQRMQTPRPHNPKNPGASAHTTPREKTLKQQHFTSYADRSYRERLLKNCKYSLWKVKDAAASSQQTQITEFFRVHPGAFDIKAGSPQAAKSGTKRKLEAVAGNSSGPIAPKRPLPVLKKKQGISTASFLGFHKQRPASTATAEKSRSPVDGTGKFLGPTRPSHTVSACIQTLQTATAIKITGGAVVKKRGGSIQSFIGKSLQSKPQAKNWKSSLF